jgi:hypothetical protein
VKHPLKKPAIRNIAHPDATHLYGKPLYRRNVADLPKDAILEGEEVADWLRVKPAWVRAHANGNRRPLLPSLKVGKFRRFIKGDVIRFLRELKNQS